VAQPGQPLYQTVKRRSQRRLIQDVPYRQKMPDKELREKLSVVGLVDSAIGRFQELVVAGGCKDRRGRGNVRYCPLCQRPRDQRNADWAFCYTTKHRGGFYPGDSGRRATGGAGAVCRCDAASSQGAEQRDFASSERNEFH